jgi:hypothetical protein
VSEEVVVLDVSSLVLAPWKDHVVVWPVSGAEGVPRRFVPELPNPVPGSDQATWGYPVTLQLFFRRQEAEARVTLELFAGESAGASPVDCHLLTPDAPHFRELVPRNAWGLIPKQPLAQQKTYTARASWSGRVELWSFTTGK